jgi:hypothetical protein
LGGGSAPNIGILFMLLYFGGETQVYLNRDQVYLVEAKIIECSAMKPISNSSSRYIWRPKYELAAEGHLALSPLAMIALCHPPKMLKTRTFQQRIT